MIQEEQLQYGTRKIDFTLEYKDRKTLGIQVHPDRSVHVLAPQEASREQIYAKVRGKAPWILRQQAFFLSFEPQTPPRQYIAGETHRYLGRQYRLKIVQSEIKAVKLQGGNLTAYTPDRHDQQAIEEQVKAWYKAKATQHFPALFEACVQGYMPFQERQPSLHYRWLDKRWGSCTKDGKILLNLELIKSPKHCIRYVIYHELCHLIEHNHSKVFYQLLEQFVPDWKEVKGELEMRGG